jgi:hypothetical protein
LTELQKAQLATLKALIVCKNSQQDGEQANWAVASIFGNKKPCLAVLALLL